MVGAPGTWGHLVQQSGMFGFLGLKPEIVRGLRGKSRRTCDAFIEIEHRLTVELEDYHIYMAGNSRISIAGLNPGNVQYVAESIAECLKTAS